MLHPAAASAASQRTIASLMMSAAVPWITVLTARRSPSVRPGVARAQLGDLAATAHRCHVALLPGLLDRVGR